MMQILSAKGAEKRGFTSETFSLETTYFPVPPSLDFA
jgi:hypothetical protein